MTDYAGKTFSTQGKKHHPLFSLQHLHSLDSSQSRSTPETLPQKNPSGGQQRD